jgi:hypothetical protein
MTFIIVSISGFSRLLSIGWSEERSAIYFLRFGRIFGARNLGRR